jgi:excisionase family DNA binding protein
VIDPITITITPEILEAIAQRAAEILLDRNANGGSPWLTRSEAADYLRLPNSRLEKDRTIPCHREGRRVLYHRDELDSHVLGC